ncbi:hypothetical protein ACFYY8_09845 [Streptosporangium sp. NPDC001559]|uniref:hypothetical protein n=1 Tax=Streptosporangium sp. NPDC001559 TaxID=3366187 RepID=UPI0036EE430F
MKNILMPSQLGLTFMTPATTLSFGTCTILADGAAARLRQEIQVQREAQLRQDTTARTQVLGSRPATPAAFKAAGAGAVLAPEGGTYALTKHTGNGGRRGPYSWRQPPVIT